MKTQHTQTLGHNEGVLTDRFIGLRAYIRKLEQSYTSNLTAHLKDLEHKEEIIFKRSRWPEIIERREGSRIGRSNREREERREKVQRERQPKNKVHLRGSYENLIQRKCPQIYTYMKVI